MKQIEKGTLTKYIKEQIKLHPDVSDNKFIIAIWVDLGLEQFIGQNKMGILRYFASVAPSVASIVRIRSKIIADLKKKETNEN